MSVQIDGSSDRDHNPVQMLSTSRTHVFVHPLTPGSKAGVIVMSIMTLGLLAVYRIWFPEIPLFMFLLAWIGFPLGVILSIIFSITTPLLRLVVTPEGIEITNPMEGRSAVRYDQVLRAWRDYNDEQDGLCIILQTSRDGNTTTISRPFIKESKCEVSSLIARHLLKKGVALQFRY